MYFRQRFDGYGVGSYQHEPLLVEPEAIRRHGDTGRQPGRQRLRPGGFRAGLGGRAARCSRRCANAEVDGGVQRHVLVHARTAFR